MSDETASAETLQLVVFSLMDETSKRREDYGIEIERIREITLPQIITRLPKAPAHVRGVTNLRGKIITVVDLRVKLGLPAGADTKTSRMLVAESGGKTSGLLVDDVEQVMRISAKDVDPSIPEALEAVQYVKGVAKSQGRLIVLLDLNKLLEGSDVTTGMPVRRKE
ncbi:MAG TPA: chemotaxis protein CheW [Nitrososphaerales archaeon]|nr:chemotaxis protein CheW [Nitrososphaerales archaeon]